MMEEDPTNLGSVGRFIRLPYESGHNLNLPLILLSFLQKLCNEFGVHNRRRKKRPNFFHTIDSGDECGGAK